MGSTYSIDCVSLSVITALLSEQVVRTGFGLHLLIGHWGWDVWFGVQFLFGGSTSPLLQKLVCLLLSAKVVSIECFGSLNYTVKEALLALKLRVGFRPRDVHFSILLKSDNANEVVVVGVVDAGNLWGNLLYARFLNSINFKGVHWASSWFHVIQKHLIIDSPVLVSLLEKNLRVYFGLTLREVLPPLLRLIRLTIQRQLLTMDSDGLLSKLLSVLINHLSASLLCDFGISLGLGLFLLHS